MFKTQTVMGVPKDMPTGIDKPAYIKLAATAKATSRSGLKTTSSSCDAGCGLRGFASLYMM